MRLLLLLMLAAGTSGTSVAQSAGAGRAGPRTQLDPAVETALARSAAPASVSATARIYHFRGGRFVVADSGTGPAACLVMRSWPESLEPECFDEEGAATIMRMEMLRTELLHRGESVEAAEQAVADGVRSGGLRHPNRLAVVYMMSDGQRLVSDDGRAVGKWKPHLMLYYPYLTNRSVGHATEPGSTAGMVVDPGLPTSNLMVIVPAFVAVAPPGAP